MHIDLITILLGFLCIFVFDGRLHSFFINFILWHGNWRDEIPINWGVEAALALAVPFAWIFALIEILILYAR
jgi:hypothetical protein